MRSLDIRDMDWRELCAIDLSDLTDQFAANKSLVTQLAAYMVSNELDKQIETLQNDESLTKLFKVSQLVIKHLLTEMNRSENQNNLIRENKKLRKLLEIHQKAMTYQQTLNGEYVQCPNCPKVFFDTTFLKTHFTRRHPNESLDAEGMMALTKKIDKYQTAILGDTKHLDTLKSELQVLTQKLAKTEVILQEERDERIKLEERIEYVLKVRDKEMQQIMKEELEEFKFVQREHDIQNNYFKTTKESDNSSADSDKSNKSVEVNKIEEIIAIQAKEMIKLGNNVQKLVSHLTDSTKVSTPEKETIKPLVKELRSFTKNLKDMNNTEIKPQITKETTKTSEEKDIWERKPKTDGVKPKEKVVEIKVIENRRKEPIDFVDEVTDTLYEKLNSYEINVDSEGITEQQFLKAMNKLSQERDLSIHQNRYDYNYEAIEHHIRNFVEKKLADKWHSETSVTQTNQTIPNIRQRRRSIEREIKNEEIYPKSAERHSIEAVVHVSPAVDITRQTSNENLVSEEVKVFEQISDPTEQTNDITDGELKSVKPLKSIITDRSVKSHNIKPKERRIRFNDQRIEHQISPEESSEDTTSDEYEPTNTDITSYVSFDSTQSSVTPIPAQRTHKSDLKLDLKAETKAQMDDDLNEDTNYEIDDQLMAEILNTNPTTDNSKSSDNQSGISGGAPQPTKVQELAQLIQKQLNKRSQSNLRPPIGSVNVMSSDKRNTTKPLDIDSDDSY